MEKYRIHFEEGELEDILRVLAHYGGVMINDIEENRMGITIDRPDADEFYEKLAEQLDREVFDFRLHHSFV